LKQLRIGAIHLRETLIRSCFNNPQYAKWSIYFFADPYDAWQRLLKVVGGTAIVAEYRYDGLGRRIVKRTAYSKGNPQDTYDYYCNTGYQVVEEHLDQDETYPLAQYVRHPYYIDAAAVHAVEAWRYEPALHRGRPVEFTFRQPVRFCLEDV